VGLRPYYLGDTSALARLRRPEVGDRLVPLIEAGLVARCTPTDLEAGYSSTSPVSHRAMRETRSVWPKAPMDQAVLDRAVEVQDLLAARSQQRGASSPICCSPPQPRRLGWWYSTTTTTSI
jgi:hypothetical protein